MNETEVVSKEDIALFADAHCSTFAHYPYDDIIEIVKRIENGACEADLDAYEGVAAILDAWYMVKYMAKYRGSSLCVEKDKLSRLLKLSEESRDFYKRLVAVQQKVINEIEDHE